MTEEKGLRIELNLQFFAKDGPGGEKTEEPTQKKLTDARKEGQVAKSRELANATGLIALFLILKFTIERFADSFLEMFQGVYTKIPDLVHWAGGEPSMKDMSSLIVYSIQKMILILLPVFAAGILVAFVTEVAQVKWKPTTKPLKPKLSKISPLKGVKRLFSKEKIVELLKSILKILIIGYVIYSTLQEKMGVIFLLYDIPLLQAVMTVGDIAISLGLKISIIYLILGFADFGYQKWKFHEDMRMTKQEVKDEWKNSEGDPQIKGKIKQKMREASMRRMMTSVPEADVVITNPTHFAVALKYDSTIADAPIVTAKGQDFLAKRIKDLARENGVEIVENKPLARMLYHNVELGAMIPPELYQAVAEVLAFVYNLKKTG